MEKNITGMMFYYYFVCHKKLWYFYHNISMEQENENVLIGKVIDESCYDRNDKHINIDNIINIDFIKSDNVLHEIKKSKKIEKASIMQVKYYLYYLYIKGITGITGKIDYPLLKQTCEVFLEKEDIVEIERILKEIKKIVKSDIPIQTDKKNICKSCAYYDLCYI